MYFSKMLATLVIFLTVEVSTSADILRVPLVDFQKSIMDPATVVSSEQYMVSSLIYSGLIELDEETGYFVANLAEKFFWKDNTLVFHLKSSVYTSKSGSVSSQDVYESFLRVFSMSKNIPGNIHLLLCSKNDLNVSPIKNCSGIDKVSKNELHFKFPYKSQSFVEYLSNPVFSVVPLTSYSNKDLEISDYSNSTGRFYFREIDDDYLIIERNSNHWDSLSVGPKVVKFVRDYREKENNRWRSERLIESGEIDLIPTATSFGNKAYKRFKRSLKNPRFYESDSTRVTVFMASPRGMKISPKNRQIISKLLKNAIHKRFSQIPSYSGYLSQTLLPGGYGSFSKKQLEIQNRILDQLPDLWPKNLYIKIAFPTKVAANFYCKSVFKKYSQNVECVIRKQTNYIDVDPDDPNLPDFGIRSFSADFRESSEETSFLLNTNKFNIRGDEAKSWLLNYNKLTSKQETQSLIN